MSTKALGKSSKSQGHVPTPSDVVTFLTNWAVEESSCEVLDIGVGDGRFLLASAERLRKLGTSTKAIGNQLYGVELDAEMLLLARQRLQALGGVNAQNLFSGNFLDSPTWPVDAVIGNPPYVRRHHIQRVDGWLAAHEATPSRMTDLSIHFVLRASSFLRPGGRLAVVLPGGWLDQKYGHQFRTFLVQTFCEVTVLGFEERVFGEALVKPVLLLGIRRNGNRAPTEVKTVRFRTMQEFSLAAASSRLPLWQCRLTEAEFIGEKVSASLYQPEGVRLLESAGLGDTSLGNVAVLRIGFQSFAKRFFLLDARKADELGLRSNHAKPVVRSLADVQQGLTVSPEGVKGRVFYARHWAELDEASQTYVKRGEVEPVRVRGKDDMVLGFQEAPRAKRAKREPWFNIADELDRRGGLPVLIPRRSFIRSVVLFNPERLPATEDFIEVVPGHGEDIWVLLLYLNSTFGELAIRLASHQYGGGVFNLNPSQARLIALPDVQRLRGDQGKTHSTWKRAAADHSAARRILDEFVVAKLGLDLATVEQARNVVSELRESASRLANSRAVPPASELG